MATIDGIDTDLFPLNLGGNPFGWTADPENSFAVLDGYRAAGGNFIDTADSYSAWVPGNEGGESERLIGQWLAERGDRDDVVIATKVAQHPQFRGLAQQNVYAACEGSLERLGTDHIDLYYAHEDDLSQTVPQIAATFDALVRQGLVRAIGISNFEPARVVEWLEYARGNGLAVPVALQTQYNLVERHGFEAKYAPMLANYPLAVFSYPSLAGGFLTGKYRTAADCIGSARSARVAKYATDAGFAVVAELTSIAEVRGAAPATVALAWLLGRGVTAPIASASTADQVPQLVAVKDLRLNERELERLDEASAPFA